MLYRMMSLLTTLSENTWLFCLVKALPGQVSLTRSSAVAVAERPRDASCH